MKNTIGEMNMQCTIKSFDALTTVELFEILRARCAVFIVEQTCPYQDIDETDKQSVHIFLEDEGVLKAYCRVYPKDDDTVQIGRVLTTVRGIGLGERIVQTALEYIQTVMKAHKVYIEAQCYAIGFYEKAGFHTIGEPFDEDGIPHIAMELTF